MKNKGNITLFVLIIFFLKITAAQAQLSAPGSLATTNTEYPVFQETDDIFIFCTETEDINAGSLQVRTELEGTKTFLWEKYNPETAAFELHSSEGSESPESTITSLENGGYRVTITQGETTRIYRAWIFNNWVSATAEVTNSNCESFRLSGSFLSSPMNYYDLADNSELEIFRDMRVQWKEDQTAIATVIDPQIFDPPASNTEYTFRVYDRFGCESESVVTYESIVTKAKFSVDPMQGEAPLNVSFTNESENGTPGLYEWFFYRNFDDIKREGETTQQPIDSIMIVAYDENPEYTYENSGTYKVKLVSKKTSEFYTCVDTAYMEDFIVVDTSFVAVPNVFTPNGDGVNDLFVVKFWSMQSIKISIFNRWGKRIHFWESSDVRGFDETYTATVWDGRLGGRYASPGVYYYVVEGRGRDNKARKAHGFFHLFRGKD